MEHRITTPDGRTLAVQESGDPNGKPVLAHNGTPNSRQLYARHVADAEPPVKPVPAGQLRPRLRHRRHHLNRESRLFAHAGPDRLA